MKNCRLRGLQRIGAVALGIVFVSGCAGDLGPEEAPERAQARTLTEDYGDVLVSGVQFTNGDNVSIVHDVDDPSAPLAIWEFYQSPGRAAWEANGMTGETHDTPLSESLEEANWMAYTVWAAANGVELEEGIGMEGCSCAPCWIDPYGAPRTEAPAICCRWGF